MTQIAASPTSLNRALIVGNPGTEHIGNHLLAAAQELGVDARLCDVRQAVSSSYFIRQFNWRVRHHRPSRLNAFSQEVLETCLSYQPHTVIITGISPPNAQVVKTIAATGTRCVNYLTDDPWNPAHRAPWFFDVLPHYTTVYSPRRANILDLRGIGCSVEYLPFAYSTQTHFPESAPTELCDDYKCDVLFYGGGDKDRLPYIEALLESGYDVHLYGGYWNRYRSTRKAWRGIADAKRLRWAVSGAKITLCLVRRANRDGHVMRTYETAAMRTCLLAEDTPEHRQILGSDGRCAVLFESIDEMISHTRELLENEETRQTMADNLFRRITSSGNTYVDRLKSIFDSSLNKAPHVADKNASP